MKNFKTLLAAVALFIGLAAMAQKPFEGEIMIRTYRNFSPEAIALSPTVCNGVDTLAMVVKGDRGIFKDYRTGTVTYADPKTYFMYSTKDNTGIKCPYYGATSVPAPNANKTDQHREILGMDATLYVCDDNAKVGIEHQSWVGESNLVLPEFIRQILNTMNIPVDGIVLKFVFTNGGKYPSYTCQEVLSFNERPVDDSEFDIPSDIKMEVVESFEKGYKYKNGQMKMAEKFSPLPKDVIRFGDFVSDFMQKHPASAVPAPTKTYTIDEDWDF